MAVFTVGYEGCDIDEFVAFLRREKIEQIVDTRKNPVSRKRGFSKNRLAGALKTKKIDYVHVPALGVPREWRREVKDGEITRKQMFARYEKKILPLADQEILALIKRSGRMKIALLCYEADPSDCHRSQVAARMRKLSKKKLKVIDLAPYPVDAEKSLMRTVRPPRIRAESKVNGATPSRASTKRSSTSSSASSVRGMNR